MELAALQGKLIGLDTAPLIYYMEEHDTYLPIIRPIFENLAFSTLFMVTSTVTLTEVLVYPYRQGEMELAAQYHEILTQTEGLTMTPLSVKIAQKSAELRAHYNLRTPDAIQIATALEAGAEYLLSNDKKLKRVSEIQILVLDDLL